jgi:hypothetical protein
MSTTLLPLHILAKLYLETVIMNKKSINTTKNSNKASLDYQKGKYRALWRSVLTQWCMDVANNSNKRYMRGVKYKAAQWLKNNRNEFNTVCGLADLDPKDVIAKIEYALGNGFKWRNDKRKEEPLDLDKIEKPSKHGKKGKEL